MIETLSDAILEGCKRYPNQAFHAYVDEEAKAAWAWAAAEAVMGDSYHLRDAFPYVRHILDLKCPACGEVKHYLNSIVTHLNDFHRWRREQIAQWLAGRGY